MTGYDPYGWVVPPPQPVQQSLSTWGEAIVAAATGNAVMIRSLLTGADDDGAGINLRTFRTSNADVRFVYQARNILIDPHYTLVEIAVERDHFDVVMALTEQPQPVVDVEMTPVAPPVVARSVSTFVPHALVDELRDDIASRFEVITDGPAAGIVVLQGPGDGGRDTFVLPKEVMELPVEQRQRAIGMLVEDPCARARPSNSRDARPRPSNSRDRCPMKMRTCDRACLLLP